MEPVIEGDEVMIRVIDLNKELGDRAVKGARVSGLRIQANGRSLEFQKVTLKHDVKEPYACSVTSR